MTIPADQVEHGKAVVVGDDRFAVDQERAPAQRRDRCDDEGKVGRKIIPLPGDQPNTGTIAPGHDPHPVMLDFMQPRDGSYNSQTGVGTTTWRFFSVREIE